MEYKRTKYYTKEYVENYEYTFTTNNKKFIDLTGQTFGKFKVLKMKERKSPHTFWFCECDCGNIQAKNTNQLNRGQDRCTTCGIESGSDKRRIPLENKLEIIKEKHPSLELISKTDSRRDQWLWYCSECNTPYYHRLDHVAQDRETCRCNPHKFSKWTKQLREHQIREECVVRGVKFLGWLTDFDGTSVCRIVIKCKNHPHYDVTINNFFHGFGCPYCAEETRGDRYRHDSDKIIIEGRKLFGNKYDYSEYEYICSRTPSRVTCNDCNLPFNVSYDNHINKQRGCPHERGKTHLFTYLLSISEDNIPIGIKLGKATKYDKRIDEHIRGNPNLQIDIIGVWQYLDTDWCNKSESRAKRELPCSYLDNKTFLTGSTETLSVSEIDNVIKIFEETRGVRII